MCRGELACQVPLCARGLGTADQSHIGVRRSPTPSQGPPLPTHLVSIRMSALVGLSTALQMSSWVTGMDLFMDTHRSDR